MSLAGRLASSATSLCSSAISRQEQELHFWLPPFSYSLQGKDSGWPFTDMNASISRPSPTVWQLCSGNHGIDKHSRCAFFFFARSDQDNCYALIFTSCRIHFHCIIPCRTVNNVCSKIPSKLVDLTTVKRSFLF